MDAVDHDNGRNCMRIGTGAAGKLRAMAPGGQVGILGGLFGSMARNSVVAILDQMVVSGTRFLTTVVIGRLCGPHELGTYYLAFTFVMIAACIQESLITVPYTIYSSRLQGSEQARYAGSALLHCVLLILVMVAVLAALAVAFSSGVGPPGLASVVWVMIGMLPLTFLLEFARRFAYAKLKISTALALDVLVATIQLGGLTMLALTGHLSAATAYGVIGLACGLVGLMWLIQSREQFSIHLGHVFVDLRRNWSFGGWVLASQMTFVVRGNVIGWLLALLLSTSVAGLFAACETVVLLTNPLMLAIGNILVPGVAQAFAEGGNHELRRMVAKATLRLGLATAVLCTVIVAAGNLLVGLFYGGLYTGHSWTIAVLAAAVLADALGMSAYNGLWAIEQPRVNVASTLLGLGVTVVVAVALLESWGVLGAAVGLFIGKSLSSAIQLLVFYRLTSSQPASVPRVGSSREVA